MLPVGRACRHRRRVAVAVFATPRHAARGTLHAARCTRHAARSVHPGAAGVLLLSFSRVRIAPCHACGRLPLPSCGDRRAFPFRATFRSLPCMLGGAAFPSATTWLSPRPRATAWRRPARRSDIECLSASPAEAIFRLHILVFREFSVFSLPELTCMRFDSICQLLKLLSGKKVGA